MEKFDLKKKQEVEITKGKLATIKKKLEDTSQAKLKMEAEHKEMILQWSRKVNDSKSTIGVQLLKISKLNTELMNMRSTVQSRTEDHVELVRRNAELKEELKSIQEESISRDLEFQKKLELLNGNIQLGYSQLQNVKDAEVLIEVGLGPLADEDLIPYLDEIMKKRRLREEEISVALGELDNIIKDLEKEFKGKVEELTVLKDKNSTLNRIYAMSKKWTGNE